jgi:HPt (histidine-containing phosphotransfer) domain-containing protein
MAEPEAPRQAAAIAAHPGIDVAAALERLGGHGALLSQLLRLFAKDFEPSMQQIHESIQSGEFLKAADLVHKIRGAAGNISATELFKTATALEDRLREQQNSLPDTLRDFVQAFDIVMKSARETPGSGPKSDADSAVWSLHG